MEVGLLSLIPQGTHKIRQPVFKIGRSVGFPIHNKQFKAGMAIAYVVADDKDNIGKKSVWRYQILH